MSNWTFIYFTTKLFSDADSNFPAMTYNVESVILIKWYKNYRNKHESEKQIRDQS